MSSSKLGWLMIVAGLAAGGCVVESSEGPETVERTQELRVINLPPNPPTLCHSQPGCSLTYSGGYVTPLQQQLGCSQTYWYGSGSGGFVGQASYCDDTPTNREMLRNSGYLLYIYGPGYCNECLHVPQTQIFVFWTKTQGPGCPSSCYPVDSPVVL